jgi:hypothetical protein
LLGVTDPATGRHVVTQVIHPDAAVGLGLGGPAGGDLYFDVAPGYEPVSGLTADALWTWPSPIGGGAHGFWPLRAKMQAICFIGGPGVLQGARLSGIRQIDVAPTLSRLLGIPIPRDARGHVLGEAMQDNGVSKTGNRAAD